MREPIYHDPNAPENEGVERYRIMGGEWANGNYGLLAGQDKEGEGKKRYIIYIVRDEVMFDVNSELHVLVRSRRTAEGDQQNIIERTEDMGRIFTRWIERRVADVRKVLSNYLLMPEHKRESDTIKVKVEDVFLLNMPSNWPNNLLSGLRANIHDYIVYGVESDYLKLAIGLQDPLAQSKQADAEAMLECVGNAANKRVGAVKKSYHPF